MKGRNKGSRRRQNVKKQDKMQADTMPFSRMEEERLRRRGKVRAEPLRSELARHSFLSWKFYPPKLTHASDSRYSYSPYLFFGASRFHAEDKQMPDILCREEGVAVRVMSTSANDQTRVSRTAKTQKNVTKRDHNQKSIDHAVEVLAESAIEIEVRNEMIQASEAESLG